MPKASKPEANYRQSVADQRCSTCRFFRQPDTCDVVEGVIDPDFVSDLFQPIEEDIDPSVLEQQLFGGPTSAPS